jgi:hypothetical protein
MTIGSYGVNYPADVSVTKGSNDMSAHVQSVAAGRTPSWCSAVTRWAPPRPTSWSP